ncbi:MAG: hypothetical protein ONA69_10115, partial [candidate division KSB1 bacterium]|nr:hypothetical protein [candidate division KSB1 bacterium]
LFSLPEPNSAALAAQALPNLQATGSPDKSVGGAFFRSLLVPGWGQAYLGAKGAAERFLGVEAALWLTYAGFMRYSNIRRQDYRAYAAAHAGVDLAGKPNSFFINIGNFESLEDYNAYLLQQRNTIDYYYDLEAYYWQWDSPESRKKFRDLRIDSDRARNRAGFAVGAVVANHLISAVEAVWRARRWASGRGAATSLHLQMGDGIIRPYMEVALTYRF